MSGRTILFTTLILLPVIFGRQIDYSRTRRGLGSAMKHSRNTRSGSSNLKPHLRMRSIPPEFLYVSLGDNKVLECDAGGNPPPTIHWLKNGKRIQQNPMELNEVDDGNFDTNPLLGLSFTKSRLFIDCITEQDIGEYTCVAQNPYYRISSNTKVEMINKSKVTEDAFCLTKKSYGIPARIYMWTHIRMELTGSVVQLFCRVGGKPEPEVKWINQDDEIIHKSEKYEILESGDLIIRDINWSDMGNYVCITKNIHGTDQTSTFLYPTKPEK